MSDHTTPGPNRCDCGGTLGPAGERVQTCEDCGAVYEDGDRQSFTFECEHGHTWTAATASRCPDCGASRVYEVIEEVGDRVPV